MDKVDVTQGDLSTAIVARLQTALGLNDRNCFETIAPDQPNMVPGGDFFVTVSPGGGQFEQGEQSAPNVTEYTDVVVTAYTRIRTDSTGHDQQLLQDLKRGLLTLKRMLLKALVGQWLNPAYNLRQSVYARGSEAPKVLQDAHAGTLLGAISVTFGVDFDWDLLTSDQNMPQSGP